MKKAKTTTVFRSAKNGRFVKASFAKRYPKTTFKDSIKKK